MLVSIQICGPHNCDICGKNGIMIYETRSKDYFRTESGELDYTERFSHYCGDCYEPDLHIEAMKYNAFPKRV